jgi:glucan 1,3-beta-glucosidase
MACFRGSRASSFVSPLLLTSGHKPWITPSVFDNTGNPNIVDEFTFGKLQDRTLAKAALKRHWDTFITENDFADIAAAG